MKTIFDEILGGARRWRTRSQEVCGSRFRDTSIAFAPRTVQDEAVKEGEGRGKRAKEGGEGRGETNAERQKR